MKRNNEIKIINIWFYSIIFFITLILIQSIYLFIKSKTLTEIILTTINITLSLILISTGIYIKQLIKEKLKKDNKLLLKIKKYFSDEIKRKDKQQEELKEKFNLLFNSIIKKHKSKKL